MSRSLISASMLAVLLTGLLACSCSHVDRSRTVAVWEQMDPKEQELFDQHLIAFRAAHPEFASFTIERVHYRTEDLRTQFQTAALAYGGPNLVYGPSDQLGPFSIMDLILPLDEFLGRPALARFDSLALPALNGHVYGLPDQVGNHLILVANTALVDTIPTTTDGWVAQLVRLTTDRDGDGRPDVYGLVFNMIEPFWLVPWLGGYGGWVMDEENRPTLDTPAMVGALDFLAGLKRARVVPRECDYPLADTLFKDGRAAYIINGPWSWEGYREGGITIRLAPLPRVSTTGLWPTPMTATKCYAVNRYLDERTAACTRALLEFMTSARVQIDLAVAMGVLPADLEARASPEVAVNPLQAASLDQIEKGRLMPIVPEMRAVWDAMRPEYQGVMNGEITAGEAARAMQERAVRAIEEMKR
jgi:maltose-binding protein MalE